MSKKLLFSFIICLFTFITSCSSDLDVKDNVNSTTDDYKLRTVEGKEVTVVPSDVFDQIIKDLTIKNESKKIDYLKSSYLEKDSIYVLIDGNISPSIKSIDNVVVKGTFYYRAHLQDLFWGNDVNLGQIVGTMGEKRRLEALIFNGPVYNSTFKSRAYVEDHGWMSWVGMGEICGTTKEKRRLEAIQINVGSSYATNVYYKVYMQDYGWGPLVSNGGIAGTMGEKRRVEAFVLYMYIL